MFFTLAEQRYCRKHNLSKPFGVGLYKFRLITGVFALNLFCVIAINLCNVHVLLTETSSFTPECNNAIKLITNGEYESFY